MRCPQLDMEKDYETAVNLKGILVSRAKHGATLTDIINDYYDLIGESLDTYTVKHFLSKISGVWSHLDPYGNRRYELNSDRSRHIIEMVRQQKDERNSNNHYYQNQIKCTYTRKTFYRDNSNTMNTNNNWRAKYYQDNMLHQRKSNYFRSNYNEKYLDNNYYHSRHKGDAFLHDYRLLGDDFFLSFAVSELKSRYTTNNYIKQSGLCISGQTIRDTIQRINRAQYQDPNIILNIGSVDIMHGHELLDIISDFRELIDTFERQGIVPIITTLAPLANYSHLPAVKNKLNRFNNFIKNNYQFVVDLNSIFVDSNKKVLYDCYLPEARYVSGSNQPHVLWNRIGRQRVLQFLKRQLISIDL